MNLPGERPADVAGLAQSIVFLLALPEGVGVNELVNRPEGQLRP